MSRFLSHCIAIALAAGACTSEITVFGEANDDDDGAGATAAGGAAAGGAGHGGEGVGHTVAVSVGQTTTVATTVATTATTSTSSGGSTVSIPCGNQTCTGSDICCVHYQSPANNHCGPPGQCGSGYVEVACNGPNDCHEGEVCCGHWSQQTGYQEIVCDTSCGSAPGWLGITMCGDDPTVCQSWQSCTPSMFLPAGHSFCQ